MDCSRPLKKLILESKLKKLIRQDAPEEKIIATKEKIKDCIKIQEFAMIEYKRKKAS